MRIWVVVTSLVLAFVSSIGMAEAQTNTQNKNINEISTGDAQYDFRDDPFLLEWTFLRDEKKSDTEEPVATEPTPEEKILSRWKAKQLGKWDSLPKEKFVINASAYTAAADECGKSNGITSSGLKVEEGRTLACPPEYPFGAKIHIEGIGERRCEDRGGAIKGNHFDIYMETKKDAFAFGRRNLEAYVIQ